MLGIDVSKATLTCTLLEPTTRRSLWEKTLPNSEAGVRQLLQRTPSEVAWVLEPTGRYSLAVAHQARAAGRTVLLAAPKKAKAFLASIQTRAKTDQLDSRGLAQYGLAHSLPPYPIKSDLVERLDQLLAARRGLAEALTALKLRQPELPHAAGPLQEAVTALLTQQQALDKQIAELTSNQADFPEVAELLKVPGIGPVTAAAVASRLKARSFAHADQFVAYCGLDVGLIQSGKRQGERGLTKQGDAELRRLLYLCALSCARSRTSPFRPYYEQQRQKGRSATAAACVVARKLARLCWSMVHYGTPYDPARIAKHQEKPLPPAPRNSLDEKTA